MYQRREDVTMGAITAFREERIPLPSIGGSTRVLREGAGPPVLLLHGSPDSASEWRRVTRELASTCACYAPDLPGLGACDEPAPSFDFSRAAHGRFLDELLAELGVNERIVLVVHDIGGVIGVPWAAARIERIAGVVITNTVVFERFPWFGIGKMWARETGLGRLRAESSMWALGAAKGALFRRIFGRSAPELPAEDLERMTREFALDAKSKRSTLRLFRRMVPHEYFDGIDAMVRDLIARVPVQVVWGVGDPFIAPSYASVFRRAPTQMMESGGHWVPISCAPQVVAAVRAVLPTAVAQARA
jgi:pimeloyl-ACP methyl ester carboxylesterase